MQGVENAQPSPRTWRNARMGLPYGIARWIRTGRFHRPVFRIFRRIVPLQEITPEQPCDIPLLG